MKNREPGGGRRETRLDLARTDDHLLKTFPPTLNIKLPTLNLLRNRYNRLFQHERAIIATGLFALRCRR